MPFASIRTLALISITIPITLGFMGNTHAETSAQLLADNCAGCHGPDGVSGGPAAPTIAGLSEAYFIEVMQGYRSDEIPSTIMGRLARGYDDTEIEKMAVYFAALPYVSVEQAFDTELAKKGAHLHETYCDTCHSAEGTEAEDDAGMLGGQWKPFLHWTLEDYLAGDRKMMKMMKKKLNRMVDREGEAAIEALLEYYASVSIGGDKQ